METRNILAGGKTNQTVISDDFSALVAEFNNSVRSYANKYVGVDVNVNIKHVGFSNMEFDARYLNGLVMMALEAILGDNVTFDGLQKAIRKVYGQFVHSNVGCFKEAAKLLKGATHNAKDVKPWYKALKSFSDEEREYVVREFSLSTTVAQFREYEKALEQAQYDDLCDRLIGLLVAQISK